MCLLSTYLDFDDKLGSDIFRRLFRWLRLCDKRSLYDSDRFTETGADFDLALCVWMTIKRQIKLNQSGNVRVIECWWIHSEGFSHVHQNPIKIAIKICFFFLVSSANERANVKFIEFRASKYKNTHQSWLSWSASGTLVSLSMECVVFKSFAFACVLCAEALSELFVSDRRSDGWRVTDACVGRSKIERKSREIKLNRSITTCAINS